MGALGALPELSVGLSRGYLGAVAQGCRSGLSIGSLSDPFSGLSQGSLSRLSRFRAVSRVLS